MPKYRKKQLNKKYLQTNINAESLMTFSTAANSIYFSAGGTSFVLEDAEGNKVRFIYTSTHNSNDPSLGGYFQTNNDLQPRFTGGDINSPTTIFEVGQEFFGYGWNQDTDMSIAYYELGAAIKIYVGDIIHLLTSGDAAEVLIGVTELVNRTKFAISYAQEVKITAIILSENEIQLQQDITGPLGNKEIFRGYAVNINNEGSAYGILTNSITTVDFSGGLTQTEVYFEPKSGFLSKAFKKVLRNRNNKPSALPINPLTTGKKINSEFSSFNDLTTQIFLNDELNVDARTKVKLKELDVVDGVASDYLIYSLQDVSNITTSQQAIDLKIDNLLLSNTEVFEKPNLIYKNNMTKNTLSKNYELISQNLYEEDYVGFNDSSSINNMDTSLVEYNNTSLFENESIFTQKEISFELDFLSQDNSKDAILVNTDIYKNVDDIDGENSSIVVPNQFNFINAGKISTINSLPTAYWNDVEKEWNYLDFNEYNTTNNKSSFIFPKNTVSSSDLSIDEIDASLDLISNKNIAFTPSYRPVVYNDINTNVNDNTFSQVTSTYGFPSKYNWQPHKNHTIKMSNYITDDFYVEKVIIKGKCSIDAEKVALNGNLKVSTDNDEFSSLEDFNEDLPGYNVSFLDSNYISSALNFFILVQKNQPGITKFSKLTSYFEGSNIVGLDPSDSKIETKSEYEGILGLVGQDGYSTSYNNVELYQRVIDNTVTHYNKFYNEQELFSKNNNSNKDLYNKFYNITSANHNSLDIDLSLFSLDGSFDQTNINSTLAQTDLGVYENASHFVLNEKFNSEKVYLDKSKKRELLTYSSLLFVNSLNDLSNHQSFIENTKNINVVTNNTSNDFISVSNRDFTLYSNIKNCFGDNYLDKSIYTIQSAIDSKNSTFNILEGRAEDIDHSRSLKTKNISKSSSYKIFEDQNKVIFDAGDNIYNEKLVASKLKPDDTIIFGINSYSNGNLIGSVAKLHDKLKITLIGKEVNKPAYKNNFSSAINKTIIQSNNTKYKQINTVNLENAYSLANGTKQKFSSIKRKRYIKDTVWPDIFSIFRFFDKDYIIGSANSEKYRLGHFETTLNYVLSEDTFTEAEKSSNSYLTKVLTYSEWKNFNIFEDQVNNSNLVQDDRSITILNANFIDNKISSKLNTYNATAFLRYDKNGYDGNTIKNYISSTLYSNINNRFTVDYSSFSDNVDNNDYSSLSDGVNDNNTDNLKIFGKPLDFNALENNKYPLESNYNITKNISETTNFEGIFTLQKPQLYNRWCLVPLIEDDYDYNNSLSSMSKIYDFLKNFATYCFNNNKEKYFNFTGRVSSNLDDNWVSKGFSSSSLEYLSYEFKIKIPIRIGSIFKNLTTLIFTRSDDQNNSNFISDVNVVIPLEYYETGEFGYNLNIDNRQTTFSTASILELDPQDFFTVDYNGKIINNFSLFNILHGRYKDVNEDGSTIIFDSSFMPGYVNHAQLSHKFYHKLSDFIENLNNVYNNYNFKTQIGWPEPEPAGLNFLTFVERYLAFTYNSLNIDILFNRVKPDASLSGSPADYIINMSNISNVNKNLEFSEDITFYIDAYNKKINDIKQVYISEELVPNLSLEQIKLFADPDGYSVNNINIKLEEAISNTEIINNDVEVIKRAKQNFNFYIDRYNNSNYQNTLLENYEKVYVYKSDNIKSVFKRKDNYYNLNFEDTPNSDNDVFSGKNRVIDMKCFTSSYYTTNRDIPGVYDIIIDHESLYETLEYKVKDPVAVSINTNNDLSLDVNEFSVKFDDIDYDYKTIRRPDDSIVIGPEANLLPILNLQNSPKAYFNDLDIDKKSKCIMYGVSKNKEFAIRKIDKFKFGVMSPYNHEKRFYLSNLNNNKTLNKLAGTKNYAFLDEAENKSYYPVVKLFINDFFVYYNDTTIQNASLNSFNTDKYARQKSCFVDA